jgi:outer membrane protein assembly factor BamB
MQKARIEKSIIFIAVLIGVVVFVYWFRHDPVKNLTVNVPGLDKRPLKNSLAKEATIIGEKFKEYGTYTSSLTGKWPRFRGDNFDNINKEKIKLIDSWGKGPKILWKVELGDGHAGAAIYNGRVFVLDYDERKKADALRCFSLEKGTEIWRRWYGVSLKRNHGISRTVPAVTGKYVITIGPECHVMCVNPQNGNLLWGIDIAREYNVEVPLWYTGQCPLIDSDTAIVAPGGDALMIGVDCATGKTVWKTPNPDHWKMSHSSVIPMMFQGKQMYVYCAIGGICGISAQGADRGKVLWKTDKFKPSVFAPSPVILDKGRIFVTAGYGAGGALLQLIKTGDSFSVNVVQAYKPKDGIASEQQTPIFYKNHLFSVQPKDAGESRNQFVCCKPDDCTKILWTSSKTDRYGLGPYILADEKFFILNDDGTLTIAKASVSAFIFSDKAKVIDGQDAWGPMAISDGMLLMRDSKQLVCIDVRAK